MDTVSGNPVYQPIKTEPPNDYDDDPTPTSDNMDESSGTSSVWKTAANLVNYIEGIGFLAIPFVLQQGGVAAVAVFILMPFILWYIGTILTECLYDEDDLGKKHRVRSGYKDLGDALVPKYGGYIVAGVMQLDVILLSISYLVLFGSVMRYTLPTVPITQVAWIGIAGGLVLPTTFLKSLSQIAWLSAVSVFALVAVTVSVVWYGAEHTDRWDLGTLWFWDTEGVIISLSIILYSYGAYVLIPSVEKSMAEKAKFGRALALAYLISVLIKLSFAVFAFLSFGDNTDEVVLNNLPPGPVHIAVGSFFAFSCILSYSLAIYPLLEVIPTSYTADIENENGKVPDENGKVSGSCLRDAAVRVAVVLITVVVAILVPDFSIIVSFTGSTVNCLAGFIFPFVLHLKLKYKQLKTYQVFLDLVLLVFGVILTIFGTAVSIKTLVEFYQQ